MPLSNTGMKDDIIAEIPDPMIDGYTKTQALDAGGGTESIQAVASAVVNEIKRATADVTFVTVGTCGNFTTPPAASVPTMGPYNGTITATQAGSISNMSVTRLKQAIQDNIEAALEGVDFSVVNADRTTEAIAEAIVEEVHDHGRVTLATTNVSGTAPASGGTPTGSIAVTCSVSALNATRLRETIENKIESKISDDVDFTMASARINILAFATGIVDHVHDNAEIDVTTDFDGVNCPANATPTPGLPSTGSVSDEDAPIS